MAWLTSLYILIEASFELPFITDLIPRPPNCSSATEVNSKLNNLKVKEENKKANSAGICNILKIKRVSSKETKF